MPAKSGKKEPEQSLPGSIGWSSSELTWCLQDLNPWSTSDLIGWSAQDLEPWSLSDLNGWQLESLECSGSHEQADRSGEPS